MRSFQNIASRERERESERKRERERERERKRERERMWKWRDGKMLDVNIVAFQVRIRIICNRNDD